MEGRVDGRQPGRERRVVTGGVPRGRLGRPGRMVLLALLLVVGAVLAAAVLAAPALAQVAVEGGGDTQDPIPDFVFEEDGVFGEDGASVVIDGDVVTDCRSFAGEFAGGGVPTADADSDLGQARRVLEQCEEAGLLDSGGSAPPSSPDPATADATATATATATAEADDEESATASASAEAEALPDTGGVSPAPLAVLPALLLAGAGVMAVRVVRRN